MESLVTLSIVVVLLVAAIGGALLYVRSQNANGDDDDDDVAVALRNAVEVELVRVARDQGFDRRVVGVDGACGLALHPDAHRVLVVAPLRPGLTFEPGQPIELFVRVYPAGDVLAVERREHDVLRGEKDDLELRVRAVELHLFVDDLERPSHVLALLERSAKWGSRRYADASVIASTWEGLLRIACRRGEGRRNLVVERATERFVDRVQEARAAEPPRPSRPILERAVPLTTEEAVTAPRTLREERGDRAAAEAPAPTPPPPAIPMPEPRAAAVRSDDDPRSEADAARREAARKRLLDRARSH